MKRKSITTPLKWHGGKSYLANGIVGLHPPHLHYVEPFCGGCQVLWARDPERDWYEGADDFSGEARHRGCSETVNDINGRLINFFRVLADARLFSRFERRVLSLPFSEQLWRESQEISLDPVENAVRFFVQLNTGKLGRSSPMEVDVRRAVAFFIRCRQSRAGQMRDFATLSRNRTRRRMNEQASAWQTAVEGLPAVHARLLRVAILNQPAAEVILKQDGPNTCFYLDPPYLHETRSAKDVYQFEMSRMDHEKLLDVIQPVRGSVLISGYRNKLYDRELHDWNRVDFDLPNNAAGGKSKRRMTESVWMNF